MFAKLVFWAFTLLLLARLLVLPLFLRLKERFDRVINAALIALALVYGAQLFLLWARH